MLITIEYRFADGSSRSLDALSQIDATAAVQDFPWEQELAVFKQGTDAVSPEVRFTRFTDAATTENLEAYASVLKGEDATWLIVAGATLPGRILSIFPITKNADIIMDGIAWQDAQNFITRFYQVSREELFAWMKSYGIKWFSTKLRQGQTDPLENRVRSL